MHLHCLNVNHLELLLALQCLKHTLERFLLQVDMKSGFSYKVYMVADTLINVKALITIIGSGLNCIDWLSVPSGRNIDSQI